MEPFEKDDEKLDIEDILREFGSSAEDLTAPETDISVTEEDLDADVVVWDGKPVQTEQKTPTAPQDTVRLDVITKEAKRQPAVSEQTVTFKPVTDATVTFKPVTDQTIAFKPVQEPEYEEPEYIPPQIPQKEPYSEEWEPEYEDPIGPYEPQEPIHFRPKSKMQELKQKLVAGPEKRYYELLEMGVGKLQLAIFFCLLVSALSVAATVMNVMGSIPAERMRLLVFGQLLGLMISALLGSYQLIEGLGDLFRLRFTLNTLLLFSLAACLADGIMCLYEVRMPCCAPFSLNVTMSLWSTYHKRHTEMGQMDTMRKAIHLESVAVVDDYYEGKTGILRIEGQVEDFTDTHQIPSGPERTLHIYALIALVLSVGIGIAAGVLNDFTSGIRFFSAALLVAVPAASYIAISRPMAILEKRMHRFGVVLCGWDGICAAGAKAAFPLSSNDLFPDGSVKMNGLKFYGGRNPDQVVAYATAVMVADGGILAPVFRDLLESRNGYHFEVETLRHYPNGGVGGIINGEAVLVGNLSFMQEMEIRIPDGIKVGSAVYAAIDGVLNGVFALTLNRTKSTDIGLHNLCSYRTITPVLTANDFILTEKFIGGKFNVKTRRMEFPERKVRNELANHTAEGEVDVVALLTKEGLAGAAYAISGARTLRSARTIGVTVQMMGGILGLLIMLALTLVHAENLLTPENLLLYELVWMIPGLLITEWTRAI